MEGSGMKRRRSCRIEEADEELDVEGRMGHIKFIFAGREGENSEFRTLSQAV